MNKREWVVGWLMCACCTGQSFDHHQHLFSARAAAHASAGFAGIRAAELVAHMDAAGVRRAAVLSVAYTFGNPNKRQFENEYELVKAENDWTSSEVAQFPERLVGFCSVNPLRNYALAEIARCAKDRNLRTGLKLHFGNSDVDLGNSEHLVQLRKVFRAAGQNRMTLVVHLRATVSKNRPYGAKQARIFLEQVIPEAGGVPVQIAHLAGAGGYDLTTDEALAVFAEAAERGDRHIRNVYFDVSGVVGIGTWKDRAELIAKRMRQLGLQRLLYGSDSAVPGNLPKEAIGKFHELPLTPEEFGKIENNVAPYLR